MASSCVVRYQEHSSERFFEHSWLLNPEGYQGRSPWLVRAHPPFPVTQLGTGNTFDGNASRLRTSHKDACQHAYFGGTLLEWRGKRDSLLQSLLERVGGRGPPSSLRNSNGRSPARRRKLVGRIERGQLNNSNVRSPSSPIQIKSSTGSL